MFLFLKSIISDKYPPHYSYSTLSPHIHLSSHSFHKNWYYHKKLWRFHQIPPIVCHVGYVINFGNDKTTSLDFNIFMNSFAAIRSLTVASLIEPLTAFAAYAISGLVWVDTQFSWPVTLFSCWFSWPSSLHSSWLELSTLTHSISAIYSFWGIQNFWTIYKPSYLNACLS